MNFPKLSSALKFSYDSDGIVRENRDNFITAVVAATIREFPQGTDPASLLDHATAWVQQQAELSRPHKGKWQWSDDSQLRDFLHRKIAYALKKETKIRAGRTKRGLVPGIAPARPSDPMTPYAASETLRRVLMGFLTKTPFWSPVEQMDAFLLNGPSSEAQVPRLLVAGAAGLGKSTVLLDQLAHWFKASVARGDMKRRVFYLCPTIELCEELALKYRAMGGRCIVIRGRTHGLAKDPDNTPCLKPRDVEIAAGAGLYIQSSLCKRYDEATKTLHLCEHYGNSCRYYAQADEMADLVFMTHDMAMLTLDEELSGKADLLIVDESILSKLTSTGSGIAFDDMLHSEHLTRLHAALTADPTADPIQTLLAMGITWEDLRDELTTMEEADKAARSNVAYPGIESNRLAKNAAAFKKERSRTTTIRMLRNLKNEMKAGRTHNTRSFSYAPDVKVPATDRTPAHTTKLVFLQHRSKVKLLRKDLPVLMLDATGDANLMAYSFPGIQQVTIEAERNAYIQQCVGNSGAMGKIGSVATDKYREEVAHAARDLAARRGARGLVVATKESLELGLQRMLPEGIDVIYFGNLRGIDRYKSHDWILIAARMQISPLEAERYAKALAYDSVEALSCPGSYTEALVGYDLDSYEDRQGIHAVRHVDPLVEAVRRQFTEAESVQAIDRLRLVFRSYDPNDLANQSARWLRPGPCAFVCILSEVPLPGIIVDELAPYKDVVGRTGERGGGGGPGNRLKKWYSELGDVLPIQKRKWLAQRFGVTIRAVDNIIDDFKKRSDGNFQKLLGAVPVYVEGVTPGTVYASSRQRALEFSEEWRASPEQ
ncbi:hypothetical protein [Mesorhizobium sp.]|uniref:hypothetical protein n=1 Tax=Mesorhizobium sp. TaxID=1871066 RepID=UPI000FD54664|nr:hypothetical protein [Mesorhizobium sp.]RVC64383.1 hypothetical protein EN779_02000 [Mesorhizobium sp. M4B.F.Ca.ET.088.02.2.1]RWF27664.1 MAG: hypothetical protein EOS45_25145 [Mesorhizobium sp.]